MPGTTIRQVDRADAAALGHAYWRSYLPSAPSFAREDADDDIRRILDGHHGRLRPDASVAATRSGVLIGAVLVVQNVPYPATLSGPYVVDVLVIPEEQRRGVATALLTTALNALSTHSVSLRVERDNQAALALYERLGFRSA